MITFFNIFYLYNVIIFLGDVISFKQYIRSYTTKLLVRMSTPSLNKSAQSVIAHFDIRAEKIRNASRLNNHTIYYNNIGIIN